ncbi:MAG: hypothetical protein ACRCV9_07165, partial [Burkholderiaceae bacterium]
PLRPVKQRAGAKVLRTPQQREQRGDDLGGTLFVSQGPGTRTGKGGRVAQKLNPGVYIRQGSGKDAKLNALLVFRRTIKYGKKFDFYGVAQDTVAREFPALWRKNLEAALASAR